MEIALRDDPDLALFAPDVLLERGRRLLAEILPTAQALVCPHRDVLDAPEFALASSVAAYLVGGIAGALVKPLAVYFVKRGINPLCASWVAPSADEFQ